MAVVMQGLQMVFVGFFTLKLIAIILQSMIPPIVFFNLYVCNVIMFAGLNSFCSLIQPSSFKFPEGIDSAQSIESAISKWIAMLYISSTVFTTTGFGDIVLANWASKSIATIQMLLNVVYSAILFSIAISDFKHSRSSHSLNVSPLVIENSIEWSCSNLLRIMHKKVMDYILLFTLFNLGLEILILEAVDQDSLKNAEAGWKTLLIISLIQSYQILLIIYAIFKSASEMNLSPQTFSVSFMVQSYIALTILFGMLYFLIYLIGGENSFNVFNPLEENSLTISNVSLQFAFFSIVNFTTTGLFLLLYPHYLGFGNTFPIFAFPRFAVVVQQLIAVLYSSILMGMSIEMLLQKLESLRTITLERKTPSRSMRGSRFSFDFENATPQNTSFELISIGSAHETRIPLNAAQVYENGMDAAKTVNASSNSSSTAVNEGQPPRSPEAHPNAMNYATDLLLYFLSFKIFEPEQND